MASFWTSWHVGLGLVGLAVGVLVGSGRLDRLPRMRWDPMGTAAAAAIAVMVVSGALRWWWLVGLALAALPVRNGMAHPLGRAFGLLVGVALVGLWATIPDTEAPLVAAVVLIPVLALPPRWGVRASGRDGVVVLVLAFVASFAGWGHRWPVAWGALAIFAGLIVATFLAWWPGWLDWWPLRVGYKAVGRWGIVAVLGVEIVTVVVASRIIAFASPLTAAVTAILVMAIGKVVLLSALPLPGPMRSPLDSVVERLGSRPRRDLGVSGAELLREGREDSGYE